MPWFLLICSVIALFVCNSLAKEHDKLDHELTHGNPRNVEYEDYIVTSFGVLGVPACIVCILFCVYLIVCSYVN